MAEYIEREAMLKVLRGSAVAKYPASFAMGLFAAADEASKQPAADVVEVRHGHHAGDVCIYGFGHENKSRAIVEIVRILNDERGVAEVKFLKVFVDDTGNGFFNYMLKSGGTMNASFRYLKNITPRMDGDTA